MGKGSIPEHRRLHMGIRDLGSSPLGRADTPEKNNSEAHSSQGAEAKSWHSPKRMDTEVLRDFTSARLWVSFHQRAGGDDTRMSVYRWATHRGLSL